MSIRNDARQAVPGRFGTQAGIAIGPILFIIAILAILAAAIAAGSGSFTSGTAAESNRTKSSALIQIGENLKIGMDRIIMEGGVDLGSVDLDPTHTSVSNALFSPTGGGISAPSASMAASPQTDKWFYVHGPINGLGTSADEVFAVLHVTDGVCGEINNRVTGAVALPAPAELGDFTAGVTTADETVANWPTSAPNLAGTNTGCVNNSNNNAKGAWYYQVLAVQ
jgi:hypothetical protein